MRRLLRPWPLLLAAYVAATVALALMLPSVEYIDDDTRNLAFVGFSPDGNRLATAPARSSVVSFWKLVRRRSRR